MSQELDKVIGIEKNINITFKNKDLLVEAFTHRSYLNENQSLGLNHNERLEFLGDAVLELITTRFLFDKYPDEAEGKLTAFRAALVNSQTLADASSLMGVNEHLLLSKGEAKDTGKARQYILANTYEALLGAIYLDQGYDVAQKFVASTILHLIDEIEKKKLWRDSKSLMQEMSQEHLSLTPMYKVLKETGPDHDKKFTIGIFFGEKMSASGDGKSKQEAEQAAARAALEKEGWI